MRIRVMMVLCICGVRDLLLNLWPSVKVGVFCWLFLSVCLGGPWWVGMLGGGAWFMHSLWSWGPQPSRIEWRSNGDVVGRDYVKGQSTPAEIRRVAASAIEIMSLAERPADKSGRVSLVEGGGEVSLVGEVE